MAPRWTCVPTRTSTSPPSPGCLKGAIDHRDSLGSFATIRPGQVNLMTAGSGIVHSERSPATERPGGPHLYGMQTWLALPDGKEEIAPAFEQVTALPLVEDVCVNARVIMGTLWGQTAPTTQHAATIYAEILLAPGGSLPIDADADERAVMLVGGEAEIDGHPLALYDLVVLAPGAILKLQSGTGGRVMLMGGEAFSTKRHVWWNFVSTSRERINQAKAGLAGRPLPESPGRRGGIHPVAQGGDDGELSLSPPGAYASAR